MTEHIVSRGEADTERIAGEIIRRCLSLHAPPLVLALKGNLGAGKTRFAAGAAAALGYTGEVHSPTFALVHEYRQDGQLLLVHFDMYRLSAIEDLETTGFFDYFDMGCILVVEWSENIEYALPDKTVTVTLERGDTDDERMITVNYPEGAEV